MSQRLAAATGDEQAYGAMFVGFAILYLARALSTEMTQLKRRAILGYATGALILGVGKLIGSTVAAWTGAAIALLVTATLVVMKVRDRQPPTSET